MNPVLWDVFISYASENKKIAKIITGELSNEFDVWEYQQDLTLADDFKRQIQLACELSKFGLVIFSRTYFRKIKENPVIRHELEHFIREKKILPIRYYISVNKISENLNGIIMDKQISDKWMVSIKKDDFDNTISKISDAIRYKKGNFPEINEVIAKEKITALIHDLKGFYRNDWVYLEKGEKKPNENYIDFEKNLEKNTGKKFLKIRITRYESRKECIERYTFAKNRDSRYFQYGDLKTPTVGEEAYGYVCWDSGWSNKIRNNMVGAFFIMFRLSNLFIQIEYRCDFHQPKMEYAEQIAREINRKIKKILTIQFFENENLKY